MAAVDSEASLVVLLHEPGVEHLVDDPDGGVALRLLPLQLLDLSLEIVELRHLRLHLLFLLLLRCLVGGDLRLGSPSL